MALLVQRAISAAAPSNPFLEWAAPAFAAFMSLLALLDLVLRVSDRATEHRLIALQYAEIAKEIRVRVLTQSDLERIQDRIDSITITEPSPTDRLLEAKCHNDLMAAYDFSEEYKIRTGCLLRLWRQFYTGAPKGLVPGKNIESDKIYYIERMGGAVV